MCYIHKKYRIEWRSSRTINDWLSVAIRHFLFATVSCSQLEMMHCWPCWSIFVDNHHLFFLLGALPKTLICSTTVGTFSTLSLTRVYDRLNRFLKIIIRKKIIQNPKVIFVVNDDFCCEWQQQRFGFNDHALSALDLGSESRWPLCDAFGCTFKTFLVMKLFFSLWMRLLFLHGKNITVYGLEAPYTVDCNGPVYFTVPVLTCLHSSDLQQYN